MSSVRCLKFPLLGPMGLAVLLMPTAELMGQANVPQWSPHRPAPAPLAAAPQAPLPLHESSGKPQWVLVRNRDLSTGLSPYALADSSGKLVRYVEPSPGVPIEQYLGQAVEVRHDTGRVILASQLVVVGPQAATSAGGIALADYANTTHHDSTRLEDSGRPLQRAELMAQRLIGDHEEVHDRGPMQSLFEWAGGKRLGRFISVGEPRQEDAGPVVGRAPSARARPHATASGVMSPPFRW